MPVPDKSQNRFHLDVHFSDENEQWLSNEDKTALLAPCETRIILGPTRPVSEN